MTPVYFAYKQYFDYLVYRELARVEKNPDFKAALQKLIDHELKDYEFWRDYGKLSQPKVSRYKVWLFVMLRRVFGLTFTAKFLEGREKGMIAKYQAYISKLSDPKDQARLREVIEHEEFHESQFIAQVKEEKVEFISSIILGLNDGLIELTGALVGFSFALQDHLMVALTGLITGVSASLSMSASAYLQAKHEEGKPAGKAALYTGISYLCVVALLVSPYLLLESVWLSIGIMLGTVVLIIVAISFYTSTLFERSFGRQLGQMLLFSLGVAVITFGLGILFKQIAGVAV